MEDFQKQTDELVKKIDEKKFPRRDFLRGTIRAALGLGTVATVGTGATVGISKVADAIQNPETEDIGDIERAYQMLADYKGGDMKRSRVLLNNFVRSMSVSEKLPDSYEMVSFNIKPLMQDGYEESISHLRRDTGVGTTNLSVKEKDGRMFIQPTEKVAYLDKEPHKYIREPRVTTYTQLYLVVKEEEKNINFMNTTREVFRNRSVVHNDTYSSNLDEYTVKMENSYAFLLRDEVLDKNGLSITYSFIPVNSPTVTSIFNEQGELINEMEEVKVIDGKTPKELFEDISAKYTQVSS